MTTSMKMQTLTLGMMWIILTMMKTKNTKLLCLLLTLYSILTSMMISFILKLTLIPFIVILTTAGGLMILFLYFTASTHEETLPSTQIPMGLISFMMMILVFNSPIPANMMSPMKEMTDPASLIFTTPMSSMTMITLMLLGMMLMAIIKICSKSKSFIRKKKQI